MKWSGEKRGVGNLTRAAYATQRIVASRETSPKFGNYKRDTKVALRGQLRGVSSDHVCNRAFGDASLET